MKLADVLGEGFGGVTNYWITPQGKAVKTGGHEDYLADHGMSYGSAYEKGYIRVAVTDSNKVPSAEWGLKASPAARKTLGRFVKRTDEMYFDLVNVRNHKVDYIDSGLVNYKEYMRLR
jgi:hypothetical protein|tara:strand:+ start:440 stop:793 length:354 start_codon:yes stop_codon:yes gene_type:complete